MVFDVTKELVKKYLPARSENSHKGTFGKVLNISGSLNYQGAAYLSSVAALRAGAGYVTLASISSVINNIASLTPDITFFHLRDSYGQCAASDSFSQLKDIIDSYSVVSIGSGLSEKPAAIAFVDETLEYLAEKNMVVVIDADALNAISSIGISKLPFNAVLTPHPKELSRLIGVSVEEIQNNRIQYAKFSAEKFSCTVILKGHQTVIAGSSGDVFVNPTGNSALAKAGSGDVLTGLISGFAAQGCNVEQASILGVYLHGMSGELASLDFTEYGVLASDIIKYIPLAIKNLLEN